MSETRFNARRAGLAAAAVAALTLGTAPFAIAQDSTESLTGSADQVTGSAAGDTEGESGSGSLDTQSLTGGEDSEDGSLSGISADPVEKSCELPSLGGSVEALLPYAGLSIPGFVKNILLKGLDTIDNPLESAGVNVSELGIGSLEGPVCSVLLGGKMTANPTTTTESTTEATTTTSAADEAEGDDAETSTTAPSTTTTSEVPTAGTGSLSGLGLGGSSN